VEQGLKGLTVDLRFNPGGLLPSSIDMSDRFVKDGLICFTKGRAPDSHVEYRANPEDDYPDFPLAVLVNGGSASASEIFAGCIKDRRRGVIVGERTFGKGSVQCVYSLEERNGEPDASDEAHKLKLTTAHYYTPSGRNIHRVESATEKDDWGVVPDIVVPASREEQLAILSRRSEAEVIRRPETEPKPKEGEASGTQESPPNEKEGETKPEPKPEPEKETGKPYIDKQLQRAIEVLKDPDLYKATLSKPAEQAEAGGQAPGNSPEQP
jgi:carboxyl-terminal processing protease